MFDFVRCAFNPRQVFAPLLREDDVTRISRKLLPDSYDEWQIMVLEYADSGSLDAMLSSGNPKNVALLSTLDGFASITIQILGHIQALRDAKYTHHDMKPLNIILSAVHPRRSGRYFAYKDVAIGMNGESQTLYVPVWGLGYVAKLADNGFASITGTATLPDGKTITQYIPSKRARMGKSGHTYNPAIDLELYGYTYIRGIFKGHQMLGHTLKQACKKIAPGIFNWVLTYCRNNPAGTVKGSKEAKTYDDIHAFLSDAYSWRMDDTNRWPFPEDKWSYRVVYSLMDTIYSEYSVAWHGVKPHGSENCIAVALGSSTFWPFTRAPPEKYTEDNKGILVMTDYRS
jgi:serine/threonine protein kinase